ncbi:MAG: Rpn family recombination-promoting nuclease/putative transposase, partial [Desulfitobacteriaceae bacterium]
LNPTITINILNFNYLKETDQFHSAFHLYEQKKQFLLTDALAMHFIELPKLRKQWRAREVTPQQDRLVRWLFLLDGNEDEEIRKQLEAISMEDPMIERAMKDWEYVSTDPKVRELYFDRRKAVLDRMAAAKAAELREERAEAKGKILAQDAICQYLEARFGADSQALQETVRAITDLDALSRIINRIFLVTSLDEAKALIQDGMVS